MSASSMPAPQLRRTMAPFGSGGGRRAGGGVHGPARRVLIVDDEALVALTLEAVVQDMGHEVAGWPRTRPTPWRWRCGPTPTWC
jgi:hypothetical protein